MIRCVPTILLAALLPCSAVAGEQYVDATGFAVSGYDVVAYFDLDRVARQGIRPPAVPGRADITADYNGGVFAFSSAANRDGFLAAPETFVPQYDGHCAYGVAKGGKVPANPNLWRIVAGKLYLNITSDVAGLWEKDIPGYVRDAGRKWPLLEAAAASDAAVPALAQKAPLAP